MEITYESRLVTKNPSKFMRCEDPFSIGLEPAEHIDMMANFQKKASAVLEKGLY